MRDIDAIFLRLSKSAFRRRFSLGARERAVLNAKGLPGVLLHARALIDKRLAPAHPCKDGRQTPYRGHPAFIAQHATATCCRSCLANWHGIARGHALSEQEREYVIAVLERWLRAAA